MNNFHKMTKLNIFYFTYSNYLKLKTINFDKMSSATALLRNRLYPLLSYLGISISIDFGGLKTRLDSDSDLSTWDMETDIHSDG